ncbi:hypothetical protein P4O66_017082 [Electrophorus voltai]|uniref:HECT domain-containing protein n=1 Tax=Electrophorus voltai TaxID=2609070 RepID=A0AAD9DL88_9TELE|nr:hypothetical protein P4O66_017082 [Electrophorus voltai]
MPGWAEAPERGGFWGKRMPEQVFRPLGQVSPTTATQPSAPPGEVPPTTARQVIAPPGEVPPTTARQVIAPPGQVPPTTARQVIAPPGQVPPTTARQVIAPPGQVPPTTARQVIAPPGQVPPTTARQVIAPPGQVPPTTARQVIAPPGQVPPTTARQVIATPGQVSPTTARQVIAPPGQVPPTTARQVIAPPSQVLPTNSSQPFALQGLTPPTTSSQDSAPTDQVLSTTASHHPENDKDLVQILKGFQEDHIDLNMSSTVIATHKYILICAYTALARSYFDSHKVPNIEFVGEIAEDHGGPRREFFRLMMFELQQNLGVFVCRPGQLIFSYDKTALANNKFYTAGKLTAWSIMHNGPGLRCLNRELYLLMCGQKPDLPSFDHGNFQDQELQSKLAKVSASDSHGTHNPLRTPLTLQPKAFFLQGYPSHPGDVFASERSLHGLTCYRATLQADAGLLVPTSRFLPLTPPVHAPERAAVNARL